MNYKLAVIPGDGIGPDVVEQTLLVLDKVGEKFGHTFQYHKVLAGGCAIDATGGCLPQETIDMCKASDAVLLGAVGGWKWDTLPGDQRPERALLGLRKALGLFANLRPALLFEQLADASPLKPEILAGGLDIVVVRELTGGIYFGEKGVKDTDLGPAAYDIEQYAEEEVRRIAKVAFDMAMKRSKHVTSVDKANVLESSRLWRRVVTEVAKDYPEVTLDHLYVDNAAMQLVRNPRQFDVIVTSNIFGDILSDEASQITGSIGMLPSASLAQGNFGMYEPVHGSAHGFHSLPPFPAFQREAADWISQTLRVADGWLIGAECAAHIHAGCHRVLAMQPFGCLPNHVCGRGQYAALLRRLGRGKVVSVDLDASLPRLLVYNRVKLLLEGEG